MSMAETESGQITIDIDDGYELSRKPQVEQPKIPKVSKLLRGMESNDNEECYDPLVVSIGPYHHGKEELQEMEALKYTMALKFFEGCTENKYKMVMELASKARNFYSEEATRNLCDEQFGQMMLLDGCFILQFITEKKHGVESDEMKPHVESLVIRDLLLLENQVPYIVLEQLQLMKSKTDYKKEIINFMKSVRQFPTHDDKQDSSKNNNNKESPLHLLQLFHTQFTEPWLPIGRSCRHLLQLLLSHIETLSPCADPKDKLQGRWDYYRSAKELKNVGIHFRPSETSLFTDITYKSYLLFGILKLPPIVIDDLSKALLLNLVAYETCSSTSSNALQISSYICFLDSLIDQAEDVKELRSKGILLNALGSDQELADLFNQISKYLVFQRDAFAKIRRRINLRYKNRITKWITEWLNTHFSSPWTVLAFLAALLALVLTAIQTYASVWPFHQ